MLKIINSRSAAVDAYFGGTLWRKDLYGLSKGIVELNWLDHSRIVVLWSMASLQILSSPAFEKIDVNDISRALLTAYCFLLSGALYSGRGLNGVRVWISKELLHNHATQVRCLAS